jgi:hypothetical protein
MLRTILGAVAGFIAWWIIVSLTNRGMHLVWPAYAAADTPAMVFDFHMKIARLAESSIASILAALVARAVAPASRYAAPASGMLLLIMFVPVHYMIWAKFPIWYHAYFLSSLVVLPLLVQWLLGNRANSAPAAAA